MSVGTSVDPGTESQPVTHVAPLSVNMRKKNPGNTTDADVSAVASSIDAGYIRSADLENAQQYMKLVTDDVILKKYIRFRNLTSCDYPDEWVISRIELVVGRSTLIPKEAGCILELTGKARRSLAIDGGYAQVAFDEVGREISEMEADDIEDRMNTVLVRHKVWDFSLTKITPTNGPGARDRLMRSKEVAEAEAQKQQDMVLSVQQQQTDVLMKLTEAVTAMSATGKPEMDQDEMMAYIMDKLPSSALLSAGQKKRHAEAQEKKSDR